MLSVSVGCASGRADGVRVIKKIGEGVYGEVYRATHNGHCVALKVCCLRGFSQMPVAVTSLCATARAAITTLTPSGFWAPCGSGAL